MCRDIAAPGTLTAHDRCQRRDGNHHTVEGRAGAVAELLTDNRQARAAAMRFGVPRTGLLGLLVRAKRSNQIRSVREMIAVLETRGGLYLSDEVKPEALRIAGE